MRSKTRTFRMPISCTYNERMYQSLPPLEWLRGFEACARHLSFSRAAKEVGITQAAMSLRIRDLEARLGVPLFLRTRPRVSLTPHGVRLVGEISRHIEGLRGAFERRNGTGLQPLKVTATPTFANRWLLPRLALFAKRHPSIEVQLEISIDLRPLDSGEFDLAIRSGRGDWPNLAAQHLGWVLRAPMLSPTLAASIGGIASPADLLRAPLFWEPAWEAWFAAAGVTEVSGARNVGMRFESQDVMAQVVVAGVGVALMSPIFFQAEIDADRLCCPFGLTLFGPEAYYLVHDPSRRLPARDLFVDWLQDEAVVAQLAAPAHGLTMHAL